MLVGAVIPTAPHEARKKEREREELIAITSVRYSLN